MPSEWKRIGVPQTKEEEPNRYRWTAQHVLEQLPPEYAVQGKVYMVTGGHSGIGYETTKALVVNGATVLIASRRKTAVEEAMNRIKSEHPEANMVFIQLDLSDLEKVQQCVRDFEASGLPLHGLICNAAAQITTFEYTKQGFELQFGTNHVGNFLLIQLLVTHLAKSGPHPRIAIVSSGAHRNSPVRFDDLDFEGGKVYDKWLSYGQSKSANILCARALNDAYASQGVEVFSLHPGGIVSGLSTLGPELALQMGFINEAGESHPGLKTNPEGAATQIFAVTSPELEGKGGAFLKDCEIQEPETEFTQDKTGENSKRLYELTLSFVEPYIQ
ncbi:hypothetical protein BGW37DRAFT_286701 [Umbelopsis sp. PMI_123]|nr:hypothetical protein BGW37DRAFT_286701 [Umbelopsis sp. PMI_123]